MEAHETHPDDAAPTGEALYVALFEDGTIKAGRTRRPAARRGQLQQCNKEFGKISRMTWGASRGAAAQGEKSLLGALRLEGAQAKGREFFSGIEYETATSILSQFAYATYGYPIYDKVPAGAFGCAYPASEPTGQFATDLYVPSRSSSPPPFAMRVVGHSMTNPASPIQFPDGCVVLCDPARQPTLGDFVVAMDRTDGSLTLKQLTNRVPLPGRDLWLTPLNPDPAYAAVHLDDENHEVLGVVVEAQMPLYRR